MKINKTMTIITGIFIVLLSTELISAEGGFNLKVDIPLEYQEILAGEQVFATFTLFNIDSEYRKDITVEYWIMGPEGEIGRRQETIAIETQASLVRAISLPNDAPEGNYFLQARVLFDEGREQLASGSFSVYKEHTWQEQSQEVITENKLLLIISGVIIVLLLAFKFSRNYSKKELKNWRLKRKIADIVNRRQKNA